MTFFLEGSTSMLLTTFHFPKWQQNARTCDNLKSFSFYFEMFFFMIWRSFRVLNVSSFNIQILLSFYCGFQILFANMYIVHMYMSREYNLFIITRYIDIYRSKILSIMRYFILSFELYRQFGIFVVRTFIYNNFLFSFSRSLFLC